MKAYKVTWSTFIYNQFGLGQFSQGYQVTNQENHFATKEIAENFAEKKNLAAKELGISHLVKAYVTEIILE